MRTKQALYLTWDLLDVVERMEAHEPKPVQFKGTALRLFNRGAVPKPRHWSLTLLVQGTTATGEVHRRSEQFIPDGPLLLSDLNRVMSDFARSHVLPELTELDITLHKMSCRAVVKA